MNTLRIIILTVSIETAMASPEAHLQISTFDDPGLLAECDTPCLVHADATNTSKAEEHNTFINLQYRFTFDDPDSGFWPQWDGTALPPRSKNEFDGGPLAAHVYDHPGAYTIRLEVRDEQGNRSSTTAQVIVNDANEVYSGRNTVCISVDKDMDGCPDGAATLKSQVRWPRFRNGKRYLLRAGRNYGSFGPIEIGGTASRIQIGRFGSGTKPIVGSIRVPRSTKKHSRIKSPEDWTNRVVIQDLDMSADNGEIVQGIAARHVLFYNLDISANKVTVEAGGGAHYHVCRKKHYATSKVAHPYNIGFVGINNYENDLQRAFGSGQMIWMGNHFDYAWEHNLRMWQWYKTIVSHNRMGGKSLNNGAGGKSNIKANGGGTDKPSTYPQARDSEKSGGCFTQSRYLVISHNDFGRADDTYTWNGISCQPQNSTEIEGVQDCIGEYNYFRKTARTATHVTSVNGGKNIVHRASIVEAGRSLRDNVGNNVEDSSQWDYGPWDGPYFVNNSFKWPLPD